MDLQSKFADACWSAQTLFARNRVSGSSANLSFMHDGLVYITASGSCFGRLAPKDFAVSDLDGNRRDARKPSKEWALHRAVYADKPQAQAVIHTHGPFTTLWSCLLSADLDDPLPSYTPYLKLRVGTVGKIPYAPPGSKELFALFAARAGDSDAYLLQNHGAVAAGKTILDAFYAIEELEESARLAWLLRGEPSAGTVGESKIGV